MTDTGGLAVSPAIRDSFQPVLQALPLIRDALVNRPDVIAVRPGYQYSSDGRAVPSAVVAVIPDTAPVKAQDLQQQFGVPVSVADATVEEQLTQTDAGPAAFGAPNATISVLEALLRDEAVVAFAPPKRGTYEPLDPPNLPLVEEQMALTVCVSPEAGWSELEAFLAKTRERLTVAMYQFTAPHIFEAIESATTPGHRTFQLVLDPSPESPPRTGPKANDLKTKTQVIAPLETEMTDRFDVAWATMRTNAHPDGLWASAYHIKVAVRDGEAGWLSSGNWQSTNQPNVHLFGDDANPDDVPDGFPGEYNREYHAIFESVTLASIFETYIRRDLQLCAAQAGEPIEFAEPELFVPESELPVPFAPGGQFFAPLMVDRVVKVQPLLTPDNYAENVLQLLKSATKSIRMQNQYINLRGVDDFPELLLLVDALKEKVLDPDVEVRMIFRNLMGRDKLDLLTAQGFPREAIRFQEGCHNKTIIVDDEVAMIGSHNWSNEGVASNRDASLIFFDSQIAEYLAGVFDDDWEFRANDRPRSPRVARPNEPTPPGFTRVPFSAVFDD